MRSSKTLWKLFSPIRWGVNTVLRVSGIFVIYRMGSAIGEQVCLTAILPQIHEEHHQRIVLITNRPELYYGNPHVWRNVDFNGVPAFLKTPLSALLYLLRGGGQIERFLFEDPRATPQPMERYLVETKSEMHLIGLHSMHFKMKLHTRNLKPEFYFSESERKEYASHLKLPPHFCVTQSEGKSDFTPNKNWEVESFQKIIDLMPNRTWIQIGMTSNPVLRGATNYLGKTGNLRELAYLISHADFVVCVEGLYNHLASSFEVPSFVINSGFLPLGLAKYPTNTLIAREPQVECAPCGLLEPCPVSGKPCTTDIHPELVVAKINKVSSTRINS